MKRTAYNIDAGHPLSPDNALENDNLGRTNFAKSIVHSLNGINSHSGFSLSVEGAWGSGKTSTLAILEELLEKQKKPPIVIHFNPWLVGNRDVLLARFLEQLAQELKIKLNSKLSIKIAKEIEAYSKLLNAVKLIPGFEPWTTYLQMLSKSIASIFRNRADRNTVGIEGQKNKVEQSLKELDIPIVILIDDIDRLFPLEVFEMIRIIKAVGDLPNIGYVLSWDPKYIQSSLANLSVPNPNGYLEKIVQVRMFLPKLSHTAKMELIEKAIVSLPHAARENHFRDTLPRLQEFSSEGLYDPIEQPRDIVKLFNIVKLLEPELRGEITLSDIIGISILSLKAPELFELIKRYPQWFTESKYHLRTTGKSIDEVIDQGKEYRESAYNNCDMPDAIQRITCLLFPLVAKSEGITTFNTIVDTDGHIGAPSRLNVALQQSVSNIDISMSNIKKFIFEPNARERIISEITKDNRQAFLASLRETSSKLINTDDLDLTSCCIAIACLTENKIINPVLADNYLTSQPALILIEKIIIDLIMNSSPQDIGTIAEEIIKSEASLFLTSKILHDSYISTPTKRKVLLTSTPHKESFSSTYESHLEKKIEDETIFETAGAFTILYTLSEISPDKCPIIFDIIKRSQTMLDSFALCFFKKSNDTYKGAAYTFPDNTTILEKFCSIEEIELLAEKRVIKTNYPAKAAWRVVLEKSYIYGKDGTDCDLDVV